MIKFEKILKSDIKKIVKHPSAKNYHFDFYGIKLGWLHVGFIIGKHKKTA